MVINLSALLTKVPSALLQVDNFSLELHEQTGWVILEGRIVVNSEGKTVSLTQITIPVELSPEELTNLFTVKQPTNKKRILRKNAVK